MPLFCAIVNNSDNLVTNLIVADPRVDPAPAGFTIVGLPEGSLVTRDWRYDRYGHRFIDPNNIQIQEAVKL